VCEQKAGDEVIFFYSGDGARGKANDGDDEIIDEALVPWECTSANLIWDGQLKSMFNNFETDRIIFMLCSCYSGGMTDLKASGRIVAMACSQSGLSYEGDTWQNGQFAYYADEGILQARADRYDNLPCSDVIMEEASTTPKPTAHSKNPQ